MRRVSVGLHRTGAEMAASAANVPALNVRICVRMHDTHMRSYSYLSKRICRLVCVFLSAVSLPLLRWCIKGSADEWIHRGRQSSGLMDEIRQRESGCFSGQND